MQIPSLPIFVALCTKFAELKVRKSKRVFRMFVRTVRTFGNNSVVVRNEFRVQNAPADVDRQRCEYKINFCVDVQNGTNFHGNRVFKIRLWPAANGSNAFRQNKRRTVWLVGYEHNNLFRRSDRVSENGEFWGQWRRRGPNTASIYTGTTHFFLDVKCFDESEFHEHADGRHEHFVVV